MAYAEKTEVPIGRTRQEIERLLESSKCSQYIIGSDSEARTAMVQFKASNRIVRFIVRMPDPRDKRFTHDTRHQWRSRPAGAVAKAVEQAERQRWRALFLVIKAKLESVESQIATFDEEFLAHIVLPDDTTVGGRVVPMVESCYSTGRAPAGLLSAHDA